MADWQIEQVAVGIAVLAIFIHLAAWMKLCDKVTRLEALVELLEEEIIKFLDEEYRRLAEMTEEEIQREMEQED